MMPLAHRIRMISPQTTPPALVTVPARARLRLRLFAFPHAGSGAFPYRPFSAALPSWVELNIAQLPGRETLFSAEPYRDLRVLVAALEGVMAPRLDVPFAFLGHSFGAHLALELARGLRRRGAASPVGLIASGSRAPQMPLRRAPLHDLPTPQLISALRKYGGTPEALLNSPEMMDIFLPILRADLTAFERNVYVHEEPLTIPITALGGRSDHTVAVEEIEGWREQTTGPFSSRIFEGGHFYLFETARPLFEQAVSEALIALV
jgi:medium-chain acyl-[acyl-carrier-protein] hydrolase